MQPVTASFSACGLAAAHPLRTGAPGLRGGQGEDRGGEGGRERKGAGRRRWWQGEDQGGGEGIEVGLLLRGDVPPSVLLAPNEPSWRNTQNQCSPEVKER